MTIILTPEQKLAKVEYNRNWRNANESNRRSAVASTDKWRKTHREHYLSTRERWRAHRREQKPELVHEENRRWYLKKSFNMTPEQYQALLEGQKGVCGICGKLELAKNKRYLGVDHNHDTGINRGLLCNPCNSALNRVERDPSWGDKALSYLAKYKGVN